MRRAQLIDGGYVEIREKDGHWTYDFFPNTPAGDVHWGGDAPGTYNSPEEAEEAAKSRFEDALVTAFRNVEEMS